MYEIAERREQSWYMGHITHSGIRATLYNGCSIVNSLNCGYWGCDWPEAAGCPKINPQPPTARTYKLSTQTSPRIAAATYPCGNRVQTAQR